MRSVATAVCTNLAIALDLDTDDVLKANRLNQMDERLNRLRATNRGEQQTIVVYKTNGICQSGMDLKTPVATYEDLYSHQQSHPLWHSLMVYIWGMYQ